MKTFFQELNHNLRRLFEYHVIQITIVLSVVFALLMALFPSIDPLNFVSLSLFILPVILYSISTFLYRDDGPVQCSIPSRSPVLCSVSSQLLASMIIQLIPFVLYTTILLVRGHHINVFLFFIVFLGGALLHTLIGMVLAITSKTSQQIAYGYLVYILVFSLTPILYINGIIPYAMQYVMLISPAYVAGLLIDNVLAGVQYSSDWLIWLAAILEFGGIFLLIRFAIIPFYTHYIHTHNVK
jgi:hypothetical protein